MGQDGRGTLWVRLQALKNALAKMTSGARVSSLGLVRPQFPRLPFLASSVRVADDPLEGAAVPVHRSPQWTESDRSPLLQPGRRFHCLTAARVRGSHALTDAIELRSVSSNAASRLSHSPPEVLNGA